MNVLLVDAAALVRRFAQVKSAERRQSNFETRRREHAHAEQFAIARAAADAVESETACSMNVLLVDAAA